MQQPDAASIEARNVGKAFDGRRVLDGLSIRVARGDIVGLLGANGSGKTTLLRILLGLLPPDSGEATILGAPGQDMPPEIRARVGYVPQSSQVFGWFTGSAMLRYVGSFYPGYDAGYAQALAGRLQVSLKTAIETLSPGQQQRLSFVRAMATRPDVLVLDEPMAALDPAARLMVIEELLRAHAERATSILVSSHLVHDLERYCTHLAIIEGGRVAAFQPMSFFTRLARVIVTGDESRLTSTDFPHALHLRTSAPGERSIVVPQERIGELGLALPPGTRLREDSSDLEAVISEWMR